VELNCDKLNDIIWYRVSGDTVGLYNIGLVTKGGITYTYM